MKRFFIIAACVAGLLTSACSSPRGPHEANDTLIGAGGGAIGGGLLGAVIGGPRGALLGAGVGAVAGGLIGKSYGQTQDDQRRTRY
jgi:uncharacterized protein YcfJ